MSLTFKAQCYLAAWDQGLPLEGGLAYAEQLAAIGLDYSWDSLARIDRFLDVLHTELVTEPNQFLADTENTNLLYLLGFYVGEVRARATGQPARWVTWQELLEIDSGMGMFGEGFHSSAVQTAPGLFLPLVSITTRLFEGPDDKSVQFSAGMELDFTVSTPNRQPLAPIPAQNLRPDWQEAFSRLRGAVRADYLRPQWPQWFASDPLDRLRTDTPILLKTGRMVWAAVVQANSGLFDGSISGAPLEVLYDPRGLTPPEDLRTIAHRLFALKGQQTSHPQLQIYADHLQNEMTRLFGWVTPQELLPYPLSASTTMLYTIGLPGRKLAINVIPILVSEECPGSVAPAPWEVWPPEFFDYWARALGLTDIRQPESPPTVEKPASREIVEGERLYNEGLTYWNGKQAVGLALWRKGRRDEAQALEKWQAAAAKQHYLATCALIFHDQEWLSKHRAHSHTPQFQEIAMHSQGLMNQAILMAEYRIGWVEAAKLNLREDHPYPFLSRQMARNLLELASRLDDPKADALLADLNKSGIDKMSH